MLGLGNELLGDDAVGLLASRRVAGKLGSRADHAEACGCTLDLLPRIAGYERLVVLDAYLSHADPPGRTVRTAPERLPPGFGYRSFHTLPFRELLEFGRLCGVAVPAEVVVHRLCLREVTTFGRAIFDKHDLKRTGGQRRHVGRWHYCGVDALLHRKARGQ